jgi:hypothetical protein
MYLSNIRRIELEAMGIAVILHLLALLLYGIAIGKTPDVHFVGPAIKVNLGSLGEPELVSAPLAGCAQSARFLYGCSNAPHPPCGRTICGCNSDRCR